MFWKISDYDIFMTIVFKSTFKLYLKYLKIYFTVEEISFI